MVRFKNICTATVGAGLAVLALGATTFAPHATAADSIGLQVITFRWAHITGADDCPQVVTNITKTYLEHYALPNERERLAKSENANELTLRMSNTAGKSDICSSPHAYIAEHPDYPPLPEDKSKVSLGMNLDGTSDGHATANTCAHPKFKGVHGERGVDNQLYRALGCNLSFRYDPRTLSDITDPFQYNASDMGNKEFAIGEQNYLFEIVPKDGTKDGDVDVHVYLGKNTVVMGGNARPVPWTTQTVDPDPKWHRVVHGKLVNGHLTTEPFDFLMKRRSLASMAVYDIRGARLDLQMQPDGSAKGLLAGYFPITQLQWFTTSGYGRPVTASSSMACPAQVLSLEEHADGYPDAETGQCTAISGAIAIETVPTFIVQPGATKTASATP